MKILFVTSQENDYGAATLWDGLRDVCGWKRVFMASPSNHPPRFPDAADPQWASFTDRSEPFDLMVLNACFLRDYDWHWPHNLRHWIKPNAKIVYVEGWDDAHEVHDPLTESNPPFPVDVVFRRELDPEYPYPYACEPLGFGAPERWFKSTEQWCSVERPWDVFALATVHADAIRWDVLPKVFQTSKRHKSLAGNPPHGAIAHAKYLDLMRQSKLCICPTGGARCDCLRTYEAAACGCIPVFVGYPPWLRDPWFGEPIQCFDCMTADELPAKIEYALSQDLDYVRCRLLNHAKECHTTRARALTLLKAVGMA